MRKYGYILVLITLVAVIQPSLLLSLGISIYMPDIVAVLVAAQAFTRNLKLSASIAVYAGFIVDLFSPNVALLGVSSLSYLVIVLIVNKLVSAPHDSPWKPVIAAALAPVSAVLIRATVLIITNQPIAVIQVPTYLSTQIISGFVFALLLVPVIDLLDRPLYRDSLPLRVRS